MSDLPRFDNNRACAKCGYTSAKTEWIAPVVRRYQVHDPMSAQGWRIDNVTEQPEYLLRTCETCGHSRQELPLDAPEKPA